MDELKPLNPRIAYERAPWLKARRGQLRIGAAGSVLRFFYECSNYDRETKRCMAYDDRPPACRAFPTKVTGRWPDGRVSLPPACSYRADVGLPIETGDGA
jgi:Fe-S-cluster containining protein